MAACRGVCAHNAPGVSDPAHTQGAQGTTWQSSSLPVDPQIQKESTAETRGKRGKGAIQVAGKAKTGGERANVPGRGGGRPHRRPAQRRTWLRGGGGVGNVREILRMCRGGKRGRDGKGGGGGEGEGGKVATRGRGRCGLDAAAAIGVTANVCPQPPPLPPPPPPSRHAQMCDAGPMRCGAGGSCGRHGTVVWRGPPRPRWISPVAVG